MKIRLNADIQPYEGRKYVEWTGSGAGASPSIGTFEDPNDRLVTLTASSGRQCTFTCNLLGQTIHRIVVHIIKPDIRVDSSNDGSITDAHARVGHASPPPGGHGIFTIYSYIE